MCPNCAVTMTWHSVGNNMRCHYCGYTAPKNQSCPTCGSEKLFLGGEFRYDNGPYEIPGNLKAFNILTKWTGPVGGGTMRASFDAYHVDFRSAEQVPQRAIDSGLIGRLGYLDPYLGGKTTRIGASVNWTQDGATPVTALAYAHYYKFKLI